VHSMKTVLRLPTAATMDKTPQAGASGLYQPLRTPTSIRVLELEPGKGRSALRAKLETVNLKDDPKPTYEALSYTWGSSSKGRKIYIASEKLSITNNLYDALRRLRRKDKVKTIWVDAICTLRSTWMSCMIPLTLCLKALIRPITESGATRWR